MPDQRFSGSITRVVGILGCPLTHTLSPAMHNAAFATLDLDYRYVPFEVQPTDLESAVRGLAALGIRGVNVTIPHKERVVPLLNEYDADVELIGAVNTIVIEGARLIGHNTDAAGFGAAFTQEIGVPMKGRRVMVLGAGGAARAVAFHCRTHGVEHITIVARTRERATVLARDLTRGQASVSVEVQSFEDLHQEFHRPDVLINATPVGMHPHDPLLIPPGFLCADIIVCDLIYNPPETPLLSEAKRVGAKMMNGIGMLVHQGAFAFELWTGMQAPTSIMRETLITVMNGTHH